MIFVVRNVRKQVALYLVLPGRTARCPRACRSTNPLIIEAAAKSRADVKIVLEMLLKRLEARPRPPYVMENSGNDVST